MERIGWHFLARVLTYQLGAFPFSEEREGFASEAANLSAFSSAESTTPAQGFNYRPECI